MTFFKKLFLKHYFVNLSLGILPKHDQYYYKVDGECDNCNFKLSLFIKKGLYVKYVVPSIICPNCGCRVDKGGTK